MLWCTNKIVRLTLIALVIGTCGKTHAQKLDLFVGVCYGSYSHPEMKEYQTHLVNSSGLNATITNAFPPYYIFLFGLNLQFPKWVLGLEAGHGSTGGRVYYEDYSGKLIQDQLITHNYFGLTPSFFIIKSQSLSLTGGLKLLVVKHALSIKNSLTINSQSFYENQDFHGLNIGVQPNLVFRKYFGKIFLQASAGCHAWTVLFR